MIEQEASSHRIGTSHEDGIIRALKRNGIPVTREHYIELAYMGEPPPPEEWTAELEGELPPQLQDFSKVKQS